MHLIRGTLENARPLRRGAIAGFLALAGALSFGPFALGDASTATGSKPAATCYCQCPEGHGRAGCAKMCELKKYAKRWWAITCAPARSEAPAQNRDAKPAPPKTPRAEHAKL